MKFRIISDIHLEFIKKLTKFIDEFLKLPRVETLIMAGDITDFIGLQNGQFESFINMIRPQYDHVIYVLGNHEYYNCKCTKNVIQEYRKFCKSKGIILLENEIVNIEGIKIGGTTLWSPISENSSYIINDCRYLSRDNILKMNREAIEWIIMNEEPLNILITHHLPSHEFIDEKYIGKDNSGFANDELDELFPCLQIENWVFGHTHTPIIKKMDSINFICNPYGYPDENLGFKISGGMKFYDCIIEI